MGFRSLTELLYVRAEEKPHAEHVRFMREDRITCMKRGEVAGRAGLWSAFLKSKGIGRGQRAAVVSEKSPGELTAFFAILSTGAAAVPVAEELPPSELGFILSDARPSLILTSSKYTGKVKKCAGQIPVVQLSSLPREGSPEFSPGPAEREDLACLIYTSGSTGRPKGVMLTHGNFLGNSRSSVELIGAGEEDVVTSILPYWHSFALSVEVFTLLYAGGVVAIPADRVEFFKNLGRYRPTLVLVVPRIAEVLKRAIEDKIKGLSMRKRRLFERAFRNAEAVCADGPEYNGSFLQRALRGLYLRTVFKSVRKTFGGRLRFFVSGGAPLEKGYQVFFKYLGIPMYQGYGLTESSPVVSAGSEKDHRLGSSGRIASWLSAEAEGEFTFEDSAGTRGKDLEGELLLRGRCVMKAYWKREKETSRALRDGWLYTGDIGYADKDGFLYICGRRSNLICLRGGEKFYPGPVEERLKSSAWIDECLLFGEGCKNAYALVVPSQELSKDMNAQELRGLIGKEVSKLLTDCPKHWKPADFALVAPFTVERGLLTTTFKKKRAAIFAEHAQVIQGLYTRNGE